MRILIRNTFSTLLVLSCAVVFFFLLSTSPATATPLSYSYTGDFLIYINGTTFSTSDRITGAATIDFNAGAGTYSALEWSLSTTTTNPVGGFTLYSPSVDTYAEINTFSIDATGTIVGWTLKTFSTDNWKKLMISNDDTIFSSNIANLRLGPGNGPDDVHRGYTNPGTFGAWTPSEPIPEPTTFLLFAFGLLGLAGISRKKWTAGMADQPTSKTRFIRSNLRWSNFASSN